MIVLVECAPYVSPMLTQEELKKYVTYDPVDGLFRSTGIKYSNKKQGDVVGTLHKTKGYIYLAVKHKTYRAHRLAFLYMIGTLPEQQVDHINQIKSDNRWINLRDVSGAVNSQNKPLYRTNKSGHKGVVWNKNRLKWQVNCRANKTTVYGGLHEDKEAAILLAATIYSELTLEVN